MHIFKLDLVSHPTTSQAKALHGSPLPKMHLLLCCKDNRSAVVACPDSLQRLVKEILHMHNTNALRQSFSKCISPRFTH